MSIVLSDGSSGTHSANFVSGYQRDRIYGWIIVVGNDTMLRLRRATDGAAFEAYPPAGADGRRKKLASGVFKQERGNVRFVGTAYDLTSPTRRHDIIEIVWENCISEYPDGMDPEHGAFIMGPDPNPVPNPEPNPEPNTGITLEQLNTRLIEERTWLEYWFRISIANIIPKTQISIQGLNMHSPSMQARGVDQWVRDRMWQVFDENNWISHFSGAAIGQGFSANSPEARLAKQIRLRQAAALSEVAPSPVDGLPTDWGFVFGVDDVDADPDS
jgi:hypothetical protein